MIFNFQEVDWDNSPPTLEDCAETAIYIAENPPDDPEAALAMGLQFGQLIGYLECIDHGLQDIHSEAIRKMREGIPVPWGELMPSILERLREIAR